VLGLIVLGIIGLGLGAALARKKIIWQGGPALPVPSANAQHTVATRWRSSSES